MIRDQRPDDEVDAVITAAFGDDGKVAAVAAALRVRSDPGASLVAVDEHGRVLGHVQLSTSWVDAPGRVVAVLVLSPLSVAPSHQRQGVGRTLVSAAIARAGELGAPLVFLEGSPTYYGRLGWRPAGDLGFRAPSERIPASAFQVWTLPSWDATSMTGALVYNDTFWAYDCVGLR